MMMVEVTSVPSAALPVAELADYLRLSSGFADDGSQNARLEVCLRAACAAIEARTGKALFQRDFALRIEAWDSVVALPIAPASAVASVKVVSVGGDENVLASSAYVLRPDTHRPKVASGVGAFPTMPTDGMAEIVFTAGFGVDWTAIPADLQQSVLALAGEYYTQDASAPMPAAVNALLAPYRPVRLGARG